MTPTEFQELRDAVMSIAERDFHLGTVLHAIIGHLANLAGVDTTAKPGEAPPAETAAPAPATQSETTTEAPQTEKRGG